MAAGSLAGFSPLSGAVNAGDATRRTGAKPGPITEGSTEIDVTGGSPEVDVTGGSIEIDVTGGSPEVDVSGGSIEIDVSGGSTGIEEARRRLAEAEGRLLAALVAGGTEPPGFDGARLKIQAHSLIAKRRGLVAAAVPGLVAALGKDFPREFFTYADGRPKPPGGSRADAHTFIEWLRAEGRLPEPSEPRKTPRRRWWHRKKEPQSP
ncbi:hypothetical protein [Acrocarpospora phusangensis]|nr:hypothetical protein [Acrocarpospora phusangensis]